jgi:hypothetical protein
MREIRTSGSEGGGAGKSTGPPYPYMTVAPGGAGHSSSIEAGIPGEGTLVPQGLRPSSIHIPPRRGTGM